MINFLMEFSTFIGLNWLSSIIECISPLYTFIAFACNITFVVLRALYLEDISDHKLNSDFVESWCNNDCGKVEKSTFCKFEEFPFSLGTMYMFPFLFIMTSCFSIFLGFMSNPPHVEASDSSLENKIKISGLAANVFNRFLNTISAVAILILSIIYNFEFTFKGNLVSNECERIGHECSVEYLEEQCEDKVSFIDSSMMIIIFISEIMTILDIIVLTGIRIKMTFLRSRKVESEDESEDESFGI